MDLSGIPPPVMNWDASNLPEEWQKFKFHVELIFSGPLKTKRRKSKCHICYYGLDNQEEKFIKFGLTTQRMTQKKTWNIL